MIKQRTVTLKTANVTLTYAEMGDIVCNSTTAITITLPTPSPGLWYRVSNVGVGVITVYYGSVLTTLKQTEQALILANAATSWYISKGSGAMTKTELETTLTTDLVPTGGTIGQVLAKNSGTDRDVVWGDVSSGGGLPSADIIHTSHGIYVATAFTLANPEKACTFTSDDGITWTQFGTSPIVSDTMRDPAMIHWNDKWWIVATAAGGGASATDYFYLFSSTDLLTWSSASHISTLGAGATTTWAPSWFVDPVDNSIHVIVSLNVGTGVRKLYEMHPTNIEMTSWSTPILITGSGFPTDYIDGSIIKIGATYYLFYKNNIGGNEWIEMSTSTSLTSGYTNIHTGDWAGWKASVGVLEAPVLVRLDDKYRIYFFHYLSFYTGQEYYSETSDLTLATGWSTPVAICVGYNHLVPVHINGMTDHERSSNPHPAYQLSSSALVNPMTTQDDIIIGGTSGTQDRLGKGSDGQVLMVDPVTHHLYWATPSGGAGVILGNLDGGDPNSIYSDVAATVVNSVNGLTGDTVVIPIGGLTGQVLSKIDNIDFNVQWITPSTTQNPTGTGREDTFLDALTKSTGTFTGVFERIEMLTDCWVNQVKIYIETAQTITLELRSSSGDLLTPRITLTATGLGWYTFTLTQPIKLNVGYVYVIGCKFTTAIQLWRKTSYLYTGTLWAANNSVVNVWNGVAYTETIGLGLIEYNG